MMYQEFKSELFRNIMQQDEVKGKLVRLLEQGFTSRDRQMQSVIRCINLTSFGKDDTVMLEDFIHVTWGDGSLIRTMQWNIREYYEKYRLEGWPGVLPEILARLQRINSGSNHTYSHKETYQETRERMVVRAINYDRNKFELEDCLYWKFGDIALTLYGVVSECEEEYVTMKISREITVDWGLTDECILKAALLNTRIKMPPRLYYATDLRKNHDFMEGVLLQDEDGTPIKIHMENKIEGTLGYRLTTSSTLNGAVALFYPGVQERLSEVMEGDYFVGFTSVHEAVVHPIKHQSAVDIQESIQSINAVFPIEEMLSNRVYRYCSERRELIEVSPLLFV